MKLYRRSLSDSSIPKPPISKSIWQARTVLCSCRRGHHQWIYDNFSHEQESCSRTEKGLVIFNSCLVAGVGNIIHGRLQKTFPAERVASIGYYSRRISFVYTNLMKKSMPVIRQIKDAGIKYVSAPGIVPGGMLIKFSKVILAT
ncbi:MAG: hypothetical protein ACLUD0_03755 [Eubacterium ramulus]